MSTNSTRSSGTQHTKRGVNQGVVLVDPITGLPVDVHKDTAGTNRLCVDANITANNVTVSTRDLDYTTDNVAIKGATGNELVVNADGSINVDVVINASTDNIAIADATSGNKLKVNVDGSINVTETATNGLEKNLYNGITSVAGGIQTQIVSYTVPVSKTATLHRIEVSGDNYARYDVFYNGNIISTKRTWYSNFNANFEYITRSDDGISLIAGDVISIKVLHNRPYFGAFESRIQVLEIG